MKVSCIFTEKLEFSHFSHSSPDWWCRSDVCPSVSFSHLHIRSRSSTRVTISVLITLSPSKVNMEYCGDVQSFDCWTIKKIYIFVSSASPYSAIFESITFVNNIWNIFRGYVVYVQIKANPKSLQNGRFGTIWGWVINDRILFLGEPFL